MRFHTSRAVSAILGVALVTFAAGCAKHDDSSSDASATASAAAADPASTVAADTSAAPEATASGTTMTVNADGKTTSLTTGAAAGKIDAPLYPNMTIEPSTQMDITSDGTHMQMGKFSTPDDFATVDAWYKSHVGSDYKASSFAMNGLQESAYHEGEDNALPSRAIAVMSEPDAKTGKRDTTVTIVVKEKP